MKLSVINKVCIENFLQCKRMLENFSIRKDRVNKYIDRVLKRQLTNQLNFFPCNLLLFVSRLMMKDSGDFERYRIWRDKSRRLSICIGIYRVFVCFYTCILSSSILLIIKDFDNQIKLLLANFKPDFDKCNINIISYRYLILKDLDDELYTYIFQHYGFIFDDINIEWSKIYTTYDGHLLEIVCPLRVA